MNQKVILPWPIDFSQDWTIAVGRYRLRNAVAGDGRLTIYDDRDWPSKECVLGSVIRPTEHLNAALSLIGRFFILLSQMAFDSREGQRDA